MDTPMINQPHVITDINDDLCPLAETETYPLACVTHMVNICHVEACFIFPLSLKLVKQKPLSLEIKQQNQILKSIHLQNRNNISTVINTVYSLLTAIIIKHYYAAINEGSGWQVDLKEKEKIKWHANALFVHSLSSWSLFGTIEAVKFWKVFTLFLSISQREWAPLLAQVSVSAAAVRELHELLLSLFGTSSTWLQNSSDVGMCIRTCKCKGAGMCCVRHFKCVHGVQ